MTMNSKPKTIETSKADADIIAKNIRKLMQAKNISDSHLANELGVSVMTIRRVTSGETEDPRISTLSLIADYFDINVDSILEKSDMPVNLLHKSKPFFIPIFTWETPLKIYKKIHVDLSSWESWYPILNSESLQLDQNAFALKTKRSMQPRYPDGTLIIINPNISPMDGDTVLIVSKSSENISLRDLTIDAPKWILQPIVENSEIIYFNQDEHVIIGVVVISLFQRS